MCVCIGILSIFAYKINSDDARLIYTVKRCGSVTPSTGALGKRVSKVKSSGTFVERGLKSANLFPLVLSYCISVFLPCPYSASRMLSGVHLYRRQRIYLLNMVVHCCHSS